MYRYFRVVLGGGRSGGRKESEMGEKRGLYYPAIFIYRSFNIRSKNLPVGRLNFCCFLGALNHIGTGHDNALKVTAPSEGVRVTQQAVFPGRDCAGKEGIGPVVDTELNPFILQVVASSSITWF